MVLKLTFRQDKIFLAGEISTGEMNPVAPRPPLKKIPRSESNGGIVL